MNRQKLLQQMIGVTLVALLLVGCGTPAATPTPDRVATGVAEAKAVAATLTAEAPTAIPTAIATDTPVPTATPTPIPPTETPVSPATLMTGPWKITLNDVHPTGVTMISLDTMGDGTIRMLLGDFQALTFELENTAEITSTLELIPKAIDISGHDEVYHLQAAALVEPGGDPDVFWFIFSDLIRGSRTVMLPDGGTATASFDREENGGVFCVDVSGGGVVELQLAFKLPTGTGRYELSWPELPSMHLGEILVPTPAPTNTPIPPTAIPVPPTPTLPPSSEATISVKLESPVVLMEDGIKVTVTNVGPVVKTGGYIRPEHQETHHLLELTVLVENLTDGQVSFGPDAHLWELEDGQAADDYEHAWKAFGDSLRFMSMKDQAGHEFKVAGIRAEAFLDDKYHSYSVIFIQAGETQELGVAFVVPNELKQFTLRLK